MIYDVPGICGDGGVGFSGNIDGSVVLGAGTVLVVCNFCFPFDDPVRQPMLRIIATMRKMTATLKIRREFFMEGLFSFRVFVDADPGFKKTPK